MVLTSSAVPASAQVPAADNYYAALNSAVFSDGSFCYVPKGVRCPMEVATYFRINAETSGQVRRTSCRSAQLGHMVANDPRRTCDAWLAALLSARNLAVLMIAVRQLASPSKAHARASCSRNFAYCMR